MVLINSLRAGGELITDVGIGQSIIKDRDGGSVDFYCTAWTIQIIRGFFLFFIALTVTIPFSNLYDSVELIYLIPICATVFIITGFVSPAPYLLQKNMNVKKLTQFSLFTALASLVVHIVLAIVFRNIWALVGGLLISSAISSLSSYILVKDVKYNLVIRQDVAKRIFKFGKWIFLSSLVYFAAMNFDRLYLAAVVPFSILGVYGIARTLSDAVTLLFQRLGSLVIFPKVAASSRRGGELRNAIAPLRMWVILGLSASLAIAVSLSDTLVNLLYDERYTAAGLFLPLMLVGTWFALLAAFADAIMMGIGRPSDVAFANGVKFGFVAVIVPVVIGPFGMLGAVCVFAVAEAIRYIVLVSRKRSQGLSFIWQDIFGTMLFLGLAVAIREVTFALGITGGIASWISQAGALRV
jgi:O-antigen/teichoic acid export membrane protein